MEKERAVAQTDSTSIHSATVDSAPWISAPGSPSTDERHPLELLADEYAERLRWGESPTIEEYEHRFPELRLQIRRLFPSIALFERVSEQEQVRIRTVRNSLRHPMLQREAIGDFRIVREIGRGGMGVVYEAVQQSLKRRIALKVLGPGFAPTPKQLHRFRRESEAVARLHHTNIVPIFGVGEDDGIHYFAMQLIEGIPLSEIRSEGEGEGTTHPEFLAAFRHDFRWMASLAAQVADALSYAHQHGVLHRDVKPSNLLLDRRGEVWITDFGLAKMTERQDLTQTGDLVGTLSYMAPEQLEGKSDARTDIYGLGLTLFELVTGKPAFPPTESLMERLQRHRFPMPRSLRGDVPRDLETIILKATAQDPAARYETAADLAEDLRRFVEDRPILGRRASSMERLARWCRRNPALAVSSGLAAMLLCTVALVATIGNWRTSLALVDARDAREGAERSERWARLAQERAETNLHVAIEAFEGIFDHVASRGVPRSLELELDNDETPRQETVLTDADAELLRNLLTFYEQLTRQNSEDVELRSKTATAHRRIGQIRQRLGQAAEADESLVSALTMFRQLHEQFPDRVEFLVAMARLENDRGILWGDSLRPGHPPPLPSDGRDPDAGRENRSWRDVVRQHRKAARFLSEHASRHGEDTTLRLELARSYDLASSVLTRIGMARMVLDAFHVPGSPGIPPGGGPPRGPQSPGSLHGPGPPHGPGRGHRLPDWDEVQGMEADAERACELLEGLLAEQGDRTEYRVALARAEHHRFLHYLVTHQLNVAAVSFERAKELRVGLVDDFPQRPELLMELADLFSCAGTYLSSLSSEEAGDLLERSIEVSRQLRQTFPTVSEYPALLAATYRNRARMARVERDWEEAERDFGRAVEEWEYLVGRFPEQAFYRHALLLGVMEWADLKRVRGEEEREQQSLEEARDLLEVTLERFENEKTNVGPHLLGPHVHGGLMSMRMQLVVILRALGDEESAAAITRGLFPPRLPMRPQRGPWGN
jgi:eukaryotic-like serine/threonine-protein kinase